MNCPRFLGNHKISHTLSVVAGVANNSIYHRSSDSPVLTSAIHSLQTGGRQVSDQHLNVCPHHARSSENVIRR